VDSKASASLKPPPLKPARLKFPTAGYGLVSLWRLMAAYGGGFGFGVYSIWFGSVYFTGRTQADNDDNQPFRLRAANCSVPQGSVKLKPLEFTDNMEGPKS